MTVDSDHGAVTEATTRADRKRRTILDAGREVFLAEGYRGASMDAVTALAGVSKQTVYAHFGTKEALFVEVVADMTRAVSARVHDVESARPPAPDKAAAWLERYAIRQLTQVLEPSVLQLRRLVISEAERFPDLARVLWDEGPARAMADLAGHIATLSEAGVWEVDDPAAAAEQLNWLIMGQPLNQAMLLGSTAALDRRQVRAQARRAVRAFLTIYGVRE